MLDREVIAPLPREPYPRILIQIPRAITETLLALQHSEAWTAIVSGGLGATRVRSLATGQIALRTGCPACGGAGFAGTDGFDHKFASGTTLKKAFGSVSPRGATESGAEVCVYVEEVARKPHQN